jgi:Rha family phage regulatory protein
LRGIKEINEIKMNLTIKTQTEYTDKVSVKSLARIGVRNTLQGDLNAPILFVAFFCVVKPPYYGGLDCGIFGCASSLVGWYANSVQLTTQMIGVFVWCLKSNYKEAIMPNQIVSIDPSAISVQNNQLTTTSKCVSQFFGKRHSHVLEKIESLDCSAQFTSANFSAHVENIEAGAVSRDSKYYQITKDGFMFLVMGFTGKKAAQIKEAYIHAFNKMADQLQEQLDQLPSSFLNNYRVLMSWAGGDLTGSTVVKPEQFITDKKQLLMMVNEPGFFSLEEIHALSACVNNRLIQLNNDLSNTLRLIRKVR